MELKTVLQIPIYLFALVFLFWSPQIAGFLNVVKFLDFRQPRADLLRWALMMQKILRIKYYRIKTGHVLHQQGKSLFQCNHRSWSDFFVDHYLTGGRSAALSRLMVFFALPVFMFYGLMSRSMFFFKRGNTQDKEKFNNWLDKRWSGSPFPGLIVYPEGHRNITTTSLALRKGMLRYAFLRGVPCQVVIGHNKEEPFSEKKWRVQFGVTIHVAYSRVINPKEYEDFEDFFKETSNIWFDLWKLVFHDKSSKDDLVPFVWKEIEAFDFPMIVRVNSAIAMMFGMLLLLILCYSFVNVILL